MHYHNRKSLDRNTFKYFVRVCHVLTYILFDTVEETDVGKVVLVLILIADPHALVASRRV